MYAESYKYLRRSAAAAARALSLFLRISSNIFALFKNLSWCWFLQSIPVQLNLFSPLSFGVFLNE